MDDQPAVPSQHLHDDLSSDDPWRQLAAIQTLCKQDPDRPQPGVALRLVELTGSSNDQVRMYAADALESGVSLASEDVDGVASRLHQDNDGEVSYWAATLLGRQASTGGLGSHLELVVERLQRCVVDSPYLPARERATWALGRIGPSAAAAMPDLRSIAADGPPRLRRLAMEALEAIRGVAA